MLAAGLVHTAEGGTATVLVSKQQAGNGPRRASLVEFDSSGVQVAERDIGCYGQDGLLAIDGAISTICPDGSVLQHPKLTRIATWIRLGSSVEVLQNRTLAIVDQVTAHTLLQDLNTNRLSPVADQAPEISHALAYSQRTRAEAARMPQPGITPDMGREIIVMDTASDSTGWYELIYPYHAPTGPAVVKFSNAGKVVDRFRCSIPAEKKGTIHKMEVQGNSLVFGTVAGSVIKYHLNR